MILLPVNNKDVLRSFFDANVPLVIDKGRAMKAYTVLEWNTTVPLPYEWQIYSNAFMLKFRSFVFSFQDSLGKQG